MGNVIGEKQSNKEIGKTFFFFQEDKIDVFAEKNFY